MKTFEEGDYGQYIEHDFRHRWLKPEHLYAKLHKFEHHSNLNIKQIGESVEDRPIYSIHFGSGKTRILLWSQMHGNEPTATMALMDLLNFLGSDDQYNDYRKLLTEHLNIRIIPMLNPDGAERFTRRNALNVDLNRDAASHSMPEMQLLMQQVNTFTPDWAFNLHDQRNIFSVGQTNKSATIGFLSAAADITQEKTPTREKCMQLIVDLAREVRQHIDGHISRFSDEFYPRALGEYFHSHEIPCVLIESGAYKEDEFRDVARKMNFLSFLRAFEVIISGKYQQNELKEYEAIPENTTNMLDLIIRKCSMTVNEKTFTVDVGLLYKENPDFASGMLSRQLIISDIGDLSFHHGFEEWDGGELHFEKLPTLDKAANFSVKLKDGSRREFAEGILID